MANGKKAAKKIVSKLTRTVRRSTYRELKKKAEDLANEIDSQLSGKLTLTPQEEKIKERVRLLRELITKQENGKGVDSDPGFNEELEQIKDDLVTLQTQLKNEQVSHADTYIKLNNLAVAKEEVEQKLKEAGTNQQKSEKELAAEREKVAQLEAELATAQEEQNARPTAQELQRIKEERDVALNENNQAQQKLDELQNELDEMDELLANKNTQIANLVHQSTKIKVETNSEWEKKYNKLLEELLDLTENNNKLKEEYEKELERLKNQENTPKPDLAEKQKELDLLRKTSETLKRENQTLQEIIISLKSGNPQEKMEKNQQITEILEKRLVDCCSECLVGKQEEDLSEAKKEIFQLCERLEIALPKWLEKKIESAATYKQLIGNLSDIHDRRAIIEIQKAQAEKTGQLSGESFTSTEPRKEINPGVKQFLWITGILALISSILAIVKKWRSSKLRKK